MIRELKIVKNISKWYFGKNVLPYWVILLMDAMIVFTSAVFTYWVTNRTMLAFENRFAMLYTALLFAVLSWVGAKVFKTTLACFATPAPLTWQSWHTPT